MPICRVCQNENEIVISLAIGDGAEHEAYMLSQFFDLSVRKTLDTFLIIHCVLLFGNYLILSHFRFHYASK